MSEPQVGSVPFDEAIAYLRDKVKLPSKRWTDLWEGQHARGFVVAGAVQDEILADFQTSLIRALDQGTTKEQWRDEFDRIAAGWQGNWRGKGSEKGRAWRSSVIWDTNCRMAYAAGEWQQIQATKADRPFLLYSAVMDLRTRPDHARWAGTILPVDDPWWHTHYPPNGWYCRCQVIQLSQRDLDRRGWGVTPAPAIGTRPWRNPATGAVIHVPDGIDPGFAYNVGIAGDYPRAREMMQTYAEAQASLIPDLARRTAASYGRPERVPVDAAQASVGEAATSVEDATSTLTRIFGGADYVAKLPDGTGVTMNAQALAEHFAKDLRRLAFAPLIPELLADPFEIWGALDLLRSGRTRLVKRVVKVVRLDRDRAFILVAEFDRGYLGAITFTPLRDRDVPKIREGVLLYAR